MMKQLWMGVAAVLVAAACSSSNNGNQSSTKACSDLAAKCPYCTLPNLKSTCDSAVASQDPSSCQDGLNDHDIQTNCVPHGGNGGSGNGGSGNGGSSNGGSGNGGSGNGGSSNGGSSNGGSSSGGSSGGTGCASLCSHAGAETPQQAQCVAAQALSLGYNWTGNSTCMAIATPAQCNACASDLKMTNADCSSVENSCF